MAESTIIKTKRDGSITFTDGTAVTPLTYTVAFEAGDLSISIPGETVNLFLDRGRITSPPSIRYGDDQPITFSFTAQLRDVSEGITDLVSGRGGATSTWVSTMGATGEVFTLTMAFTIEGTEHGDAADHVITMNYCHITGSISEGDPSSISISGTAYDVYPTVS